MRLEECLILILVEQGKESTTAGILLIISPHRLRSVGCLFKFCYVCVGPCSVGIVGA